MANQVTVLGTMLDYQALEKILKYRFQNAQLLAEALTHRSYLNELDSNTRQATKHYERLEFLGDAVLELIVTDYLYHKFQLAEGKLTAIRASLVNSKILAGITVKLGLINYMRLSKGEKKTQNFKSKHSIAADCLEAVIGALYLDGGKEVAKIFIQEHILSQAEQIVSSGSYRDPKSLLQEHYQKQQITPHYLVLEQNGQKHDTIFSVGVFADNQIIATGEGKSKQAAEVQAAQNAWIQIQKSEQPFS